MGGNFGPLGASQVAALTSSSQRFAIGSLPSVSPALRLVSLNTPNQVAWWYKLGDSTVTVSTTDGQRILPGSVDEPVVIPITGSPTHIAILCEGQGGDALITTGSSCDGRLAPSGAGSQISVTQTDQRVALPTLASVNPCFSLVAEQGQLESLWVRLGDGTVVGSRTTSMRVRPGSPDKPALIRVTNAETHLSIFCDGQPGTVTLVPGGLDQGVAPPSSAVQFTTGPRILARDSGAGPGQERTLSQVLDYIGSPARGDVLYRGASAWQRLAAGTAGQFLQTQGSSADPVWAAAGGLTVGTQQVTTSGTAFDFTSLPAAIKRIMVMLNGCSLSGTDSFLVQLGTSGGFVTTGYVSASSSVASTAGFVIASGNAGLVVSGIMTITRITGNTWVSGHTVGNVAVTTITSTGGGNVALAAELTQLRFTRTGTNTFDAGAVNIMYE